MENQTKTCKHCKEQVNKKAKRCPKCGGNLGLPGFIKFLIIFFVIIFCLIGCVASCTDSAIESIDESIKETENEYKDKNGKTSFAVKETFENKHVKITMSEVNTNFKKYIEYTDPKDGYVVVMAKFEVENIGDEDEFVSSYDFNCYADDEAMEEFIWADDNYAGLSATISAGKKATGYVFYEVPKTAKKITLEYDASWLEDNNIEFVIK